MKTIASRQNPLVRAFRDLADRPDPAGRRLLLDGAHLVREALTAGVEFEAVCVAAARADAETEEGTLARALHQRGINVVAVPDQVLAAVSPVRTPSGIVAIATRPQAVPDLPAIAGRGSGLVLVGVDVQDPGNVGALLRVAEAAGAAGVVIAGHSASPFSWKALRGSMGSTLRLPVAQERSLSHVLDVLRASDVRTVAAVARGGSAPDAVMWTGRVAMLVGGEGPGLSDEVIASCDARTTIPMAPPVESLNVTVAAAILLYAARRQREGRNNSRDAITSDRDL